MDMNWTMPQSFCPAWAVLFFCSHTQFLGFLYSLQQLLSYQCFHDPLDHTQHGLSPWLGWTWVVLHVGQWVPNPIKFEIKLFIRFFSVLFHSWPIPYLTTHNPLFGSLFLIPPIDKISLNGHRQLSECDWFLHTVESFKPYLNKHDFVNRPEKNI